MFENNVSLAINVLHLLGDFQPNKIQLLHIVQHFINDKHGCLRYIHTFVLNQTEGTVPVTILFINIIST